MKKLLLSLVFVISLVLGASLAAEAQTQNDRPEVTTNPEVIPTLYYDVSPPLRDMQPAFVPRAVEEAEPVRRIPRHPAAEVVTDQALQSSYGPLLIPNPILNFPGVGNGFTGPDGTFFVNSAPPDTNMDVGPNHIVQIVNTDFAVFSKSGTVLLGPRPINTLWSGFGAGCQTNNDGDPVALYDPIADRWIISQFSVSSVPYLECVAVSTSPDPTGSYFRYAFSYGNSNFPDYPKLGVWPDAYYITYNIFVNGVSFAGTEICALDSASMQAGQPATQQCFMTSNLYGGLLPSDLDGTTLPPPGSPNYIAGQGVSNNDLAYWKFHVDWSNPANTTLTGPSTLFINPYNAACNGGTCIPQAGVSQRLDSLADRVMHRLAYRNFGDHESLVTNHAVTAGSGVGVRWYELRTDGSGGLAVFQQGTYAPDSNFRWMASIAMDQQGNMGLGFSLSGTSLHPAIHYTGRLVGDPAGTMPQGEGTIIDGPGSQTGFGLSRWGDYSEISVDPSDDCTFWYTNEYLPSNGAFNWSTQIASFKFPSCGVQQVVALNVSAPNNVTAGTPFDVTVTAIDGVGNTVPTYTGTVTFTTTDPDTGVVVPADYTFTTGGGDNGVHVFSSGFVLQTPGSQVITATDTVTATITGNAPVNVN